jgi:DNA-binding SARP family transcriptional activator
MRFSVLGALQVSRDDEIVPVTRPKSRALLALLLVRSNRVATAHTLIDELWHGQPPESAASALRVHITQLRRLLSVDGGGSGPVETTASGYRLRVDVSHVDALSFDAATANARQAFKSGAAHEVIQILVPALRAWRGEAYADVCDFPSTAAEATRLEEMRVSATELLADAYMAVGGAEEAAELLAPAAAAHPLRESLTERLMLALYRSNRAAEALRLCSRLRQALDEELGVAPSESIRCLEEAIVLQRPQPLTPSGTRANPRTTIRPHMPVVGRRAELVAIADAMREERTIGPCVITVSGPAGIGKTTLAKLAAGQATDGGATVLFGACDPQPSSEFEPFSQVLRSALRRVPPHDLTSPVIGDLVHLVPDLGHRLPPALPAHDFATRRHRLFAAATEVFSMSALQPLVLVLEDVQWAAPDAIALLRHLQRELPGSATVLVTLRKDQSDGSPDAGDEPIIGCLSIALDGLNYPEIKALLDLALSESDRLGLVDRVDELRALTGGNPLFIREVLETVSRSDEHDIDLDTIAPDGVRSLVNARLRTLPSTARSTLQVAAIIGLRFSIAVLSAATRKSDDEVLALLEQAVEAQFVDQTREFDVFTFRHPLTRNAIYASLPASRRVRLHRDLVHALAPPQCTRQLASACEIAHHATQARALLDVAFVADWSRRAGDEARSRLAYEEAVKWYRSASDLMQDAEWSPRDRADLLLSMGEALNSLGHQNEARDVLLYAADEARAAAAHDLLARVAIAATPRYVALDGFTSTQLALVDEALTYEGHEPDQLVALLASASTGRYYDDGDEPYARRAFELASTSADPEVRAIGLLTYHRWLTHDPAATGERLLLSRQLYDVCRANSLDHLVGRAQRTLLIDLLGAGLIDEFDAEHNRFEAHAQKQCVPADLYWAAAFRATRRLIVNPDAEAEGLITAAYTLGQHLEQSDAVGTYILQTFALRFQQQRTHEVARMLQTPAGDQPRLRAGLALSAAALAAAGKSDDARQVLDAIITNEEIRLGSDNLWLGAVALLGATAGLVGTPAQCSVVERILTPYADAWCMFGAAAAVFGTGHHWLGRLAARGRRWDEASHQFVLAAEASEAIGATFWQSVALTDLKALEATTASPHPNTALAVVDD